MGPSGLFHMGRSLCSQWSISYGQELMAPGGLFHMGRSLWLLVPPIKSFVRTPGASGLISM